MDLLKNILHPIHKEGIPFIFIFALVTLIMWAIYTPLGWVCFVATLWCIYFFRDPYRTTPVRAGLIVSPADGIVQKIERATLPPEMSIDGKMRKRVSVFLNVFNVHVNRIPVGGKVTSLHYYPGKFFNASLDKASEFNERQSVRVTTNDGEDIVFVQIAGLVARRIVCNLSEGQSVSTGEKYGIIRFGSRMDIYLPEGVEPLVIEGQTMIGGETIIADLENKEKQRSGHRH